MILLKFFIINILFFNLLNDFPKDRYIFISPVKIPLSLSANFGELRIDHFHSGLDIKTQGVTGQEVIAPASGYVYRISVSPGGFGKALYLRHPSGYSTVYGHLDRFAPEIEEYVVSQQYEKKSYLITLFPPSGQFKVNQGDIIAYSGNTGSSAGPHLHYEIRKSDSEIPINPLLFDFGTGDDILPVIERLFIYPIGESTIINDQKSVRKITVSGGHGNYYLATGNEIRISGTAGFGIKSYDLLNDSYSKCSPYSIELKVDSNTIFKYVMDEFSFNESRYINSHIDYETYMKEKVYIERTFLLPNDKFSVYENVVNRGIFDFNEDRTYHIDIEIADIHNNKSVISFKVKGEKSVTAAKTAFDNNGSHMMLYNRTNEFKTENIIISIPSGALYDTLFFNYKKEKGPDNMYSEVHYVHDRFTPLHKPFKLSIRPTKVPEGKEDKLLIVQLSDDFKKSGLSSTRDNGYITAEPSSFGMFFIGIDTVAPLIAANGLTPGVDFTGRKEIRIRIFDELSGIKSYEPIIDGKWALFEYDQKNDIIIYRFDPKRIARGTKHNLTLKVTDNVNNKTYFNCDFSW